MTAGEMRRALIDWIVAKDVYASTHCDRRELHAATALHAAASALEVVARALLAADQARIATLSAEVRAQSSELAALLADEAGE